VLQFQHCTGSDNQDDDCCSNGTRRLRFSLVWDFDSDFDFDRDWCSASVFGADFESEPNFALRNDSRFAFGRDFDSARVGEVGTGSGLAWALVLAFGLASDLALDLGSDFESEPNFAFRNDWRFPFEAAGAVGSTRDAAGGRSRTAILPPLLAPQLSSLPTMLARELARPVAAADG